jgi:hypothetical protein
MKKIAIAVMLSLLVAAVGLGTAQAQTAVTVEPTKIMNGYMNVWDLSGTTYLWGQAWGFADLTAEYSGYELTLGPNSIDDPSDYWYQCVGDSVPPNCGGPGAPGNKVMEAVSYAQETGALAGQTVVFTGVVLSHSLTAAHVCTAFIKDFAPDFSSYIETFVTLGGNGPFSVSLDTVNDPNRHVQYGFTVKGVNVWITDREPFGTITIGPDPEVGTESSTWGAIKSLFQ